jgi:hypothetical protein|tara:strand:+ start:1476 stop:2105 length:630 start_codon:yes stop_codon:yes gene_type:complete
MAQIIRLKRTSVAGSVPTTSDLSTGELAINVHDGKVFLRRSGSVDDVREVLTNEFTGSVNITGSLTATEFVGDGSGLTNLTIAQTATLRQAFEGTTWNINHNLDTNNPIAQAYDGDGYQIIPQTVRIVDEDNMQMTFPTSVSGSAVVAKGGHIVSGSIEADNISGFDVKVKTKLNADGVFSGSAQVTLQGDVTGTAASSSIAGLDGGDI